MRCGVCKWSKKSQSKIHKYYCTKFRVQCQDDYSGCLEGEERERKEPKIQAK